MLEHAADNTFASGDITGQADYKFSGPITHDEFL
jgi:hypothetical protein